MHPTRFSLPFGKYKGLPFAFVPVDALSNQLKYEGLWASTRRQIEQYLEFLHSDPGYLKWPIQDKAGFKGLSLEEIYTKSPMYLEWALQTYKGEEMTPLVVEFLKYKENLTGGFSFPEVSGGPGVPYIKDGGFEATESFGGGFQAVPLIDLAPYQFLAEKCPDFRWWWMKPKFEIKYRSRYQKPLFPSSTQPDFHFTFITPTRDEGEVVFQRPTKLSKKARKAKRKKIITSLQPFQSQPVPVIDLSPSVIYPEIRETRMPIPLKRPSGWWVSNPDKTLMEEINSTVGKLYSPPQPFLDYRSEYFFISMYETHSKDPGKRKGVKSRIKETKWASRVPEEQENITGMWRQILEDIDLMRVGCTEVSDLKKRFQLAYRTLRVWGKMEIQEQYKRKLPLSKQTLFCLVREMKWELISAYLEAYQRITKPDLPYIEWDSEIMETLQECDQESVELSPADEYSVRQGEVTLEDLVPEEQEEETQEFVEEGDCIYYEDEEEMDFLGEYKDGNYVMHGDRKFLEV